MKRQIHCIRQNKPLTEAELRGFGDLLDIREQTSLSTVVSSKGLNQGVQ